MSLTNQLSLFLTVFGNQPPRFLLVESEILLHLKEGPETPVGKFEQHSNKTLLLHPKSNEQRL